MRLGIVPKGAGLLWVLCGCLLVGQGGTVDSAWAKRAKGKDGSTGKSPKGGGTLEDRALKLREAGLDALKAKDYAGAYRAFSESYRLYPDALTLYQLGMLSWDTGRGVAAQDLLRRFLADPNSVKHEAAVKEAQRILDQPRTASGEVSVIGERGALALVDERVVGMLPLSLPLLVSSGEHRVAIEVDSRRLESTVKVLPGRVAELRFNLQSDAVVSRLAPSVILLGDYRGVPAAASKLLQQSVEQSVQKQRMSLLERSVALAQAPKLIDCLGTRGCQEDLLRANESDYLFDLQIEAKGDLAQPEWLMSGRLLEATTADLAGQIEKRCAPCSADQAAAILSSAVTELLVTGSTRTRGTLQVQSSPPGAELLLPDRRLGTTPYERTAWTGSYQLSLNLKGYRRETRTITVEDGRKATLSVTLEPENQPARPAPPKVVEPPPVAKVVETPPPPVLGRGPRPTWRIATGAVLLGVGAVLGGFGISGLVVDNRCGDESCTQRFDTLTLGGALVGVGAAAAIGGAVLIALPGPKRERTALYVGAGPGGGLQVGF